MYKSIVRRMLELAFRNRSFRRKLPQEFGGATLFVTPDSALQLLKPNWESQSTNVPLLNLTKSAVQPGDHVWDIGANVGVLTFAAAAKVGKTGSVLAVEADYFLGWLLQRSANENRNALPNVHVLCVAVSDKHGFTELLIAERGRASNGIRTADQRSEAGGVRYTQDVVTVSLDSLLTSFNRPTLVKIDIEGAEVYALQGATRMLTEIRPKIYIEVGGSQTAEVTQIFRSHKYSLFDGESPTFEAVNSCVFNTMAVPEEQVPNFRSTSARRL